MKRLLALILVCCLLPMVALADTAALDAAVDDLFKRHKAVGAALYVAKDGEIVYEHFYGVADKKAKNPITADTYFRIASVTKMVSGIHIMQLVEKGQLALDEGIGTYLGYDVVNPHAKNAPITLRHLMTHTSSLSNKGGYPQINRTLYSLLGDPKKYRGNFHKRAPGSKYEYSNFGAGIMGSLMEAVTGKNLNDTVTEELFIPLGMDASYAASYLKHPEHVSSGYEVNKGYVFGRTSSLRQEWDTAVNPDMHYRATVGALWMKGIDLCRIGMLLCQGGTLDGVTILQPETVAMMLADQKGQPGITVSSPYGLSVHRVTNLVPGRTLYGHQGMSNGGVCNVYFDPETQFVFALVSNGVSDKLNDRICNISRKVFCEVWEALSGTDEPGKR